MTVDSLIDFGGEDGSARPDVPVVLEAGAKHSLTLLLTVCTFCGMCWLVSGFQ